MAAEYRLVKNFNNTTRESRQQMRAYVYVDETTVVQRKPVPGSEGSGYKNDMILINVFDFASGIMMTALQTASSAAESPANPGAPILFTHIPNRQVVADAHAALVKMGGKPPALEVFFGIPKKLDVDVNVNRSQIKGAV